MTLAVPVLFLPASPPTGASQRGIGTAFADLDIVTRLGLALRTKALNDELRVADVSPLWSGPSAPAQRL